jgi:hypothetical protein
MRSVQTSKSRSRWGSQTNPALCVRVCGKPSRSTTRLTVCPPSRQWSAGGGRKAGTGGKMMPPISVTAGHVAQVGQVQGRFAHHQDQPPALFEHHIGRAGDQVVGQTRAPRLPACAWSRAPPPCRRTGMSRWRWPHPHRAPGAPRRPGPRRLCGSCPALAKR